MKPAGYLLLIPVGLVAADTSPGLASKELKAHIREGLPSYQAAATSPATAAGESPIFSDSHSTDPDILVLPKFLVKEKRLPSDAADHLMSRADYNRKMRHLYEDDLSKDGPLAYVLNRFTIPLFSPSGAEKGKAIALGRELDRLADLLSPEEAKSLNGFYDEIALTVGRRAPKRR